MSKTQQLTLGIGRGKEAIQSAVFTTANMEQSTVNLGLIDLQIIVHIFCT
jgi:hypothetical protein